jgi:hypothetical protein
MPSQWFIRSSSKIFGPFASSDLRRFVQAGKITPTTQIGSTKSGPWHAAGKVPGLFPESGQHGAASIGGNRLRQPQLEIAALRRLCNDVDAPDFFVTSDLTEKQLANIRRTFSIPSAEQLIAILDGSMFKTGRQGIAICTDGIRWKNWSVDTTKSYLTWNELRSIEPQLTSKKHIDFGSAMQADLSETRFPLVDIVPLLNALKAPEKTSPTVSARPPQSPRRPKSLRFAYKDAIGMTFLALLLCILAVGFVGGFFLALFRKMDRGRFENVAQTSAAADVTIRGDRPSATSSQGGGRMMAAGDAITLTLQEAERLAQQDKALDLSRVTSISDAVAEALAKHKGILNLDGITELSAAQAKALARHDGELDLAGLAAISDETAEALSKHRDLLFLGVTTLSERQGEILATHEGGLLSLERLATISDRLAGALAAYSGSLDLDGLTIISDKQAEALRTHRGGRLYLNGLKTLTDKQAEALGKHTGDALDLNGLTILSDAQARSLSKHKGWLELKGLSTLNEVGEEMLRGHQKILLPKEPLSAAIAGAAKMPSTPRPNARQNPQPESLLPEWKIDRQRFIRNLVGRWAGVWTDAQGNSGEFRMTVVMDEGYNAKHADAIQKGDAPRVNFRIQVSNMTSQLSDSPFSLTHDAFDWSEAGDAGGGRILCNYGDHPSGGRILFDVRPDVSVEALSGQITTCPGGLGRYALERQH